MPVYVVSYDLNKPGQHYKALSDELKASPGWAHALGSTWLVSTHEDVDTLTARLRAVIDANDYILVMRVTGYGQGLLPKEVWGWINTHVPATY